MAVSVPTKFAASAHAAAAFLDTLSARARRYARQDSVPSLLELLTVCSETGCNLPALAAFSRSREREPGLLLIGGGGELAARLAILLGYDVLPPELPSRLVVWCVRPGDRESTAIRHGNSEHVVAAQLAVAMLTDEPHDSDLIYLEEFRTDGKGWSFLWLPNAEAFEARPEAAAFAELLLSQHAAVVVDDGSCPLLSGALREMNARLWELPISETDNPERLGALCADLHSVVEDGDSQRALVSAAHWSWLAPRLLEEIDELQRAYDLQIEKREQRRRTTRHVLDEYRKNWRNGIHNLVDEYLNTRQNGNAFAPILDAQKPGPEPDTFLSAMGFATLIGKMQEYMTHRMAELVGGLSGLAARIELHRIALGGIDTKWMMERAGDRLIKALIQKDVFSRGGGKRGGLVGSLTGKKQAIVDERKARVAKACRTVGQFMDRDFEAWSERLMSEIEKQVELQLAAALANQGLPDADALRTAKGGLDRVASMVRGEFETSERRPITLAKGWLELLSTRHLVPVRLRMKAEG